MANKLFSRTTAGDRVFDIVNVFIMLIVLTVTLYPFLNVLAISLNDSKDTVKGGISLWPRVFTLQNYESVFAFNNLSTGFAISVARTVVGTVLGVLVNAMVAYTISRRDFQARRFVSVFLAITLYVSGGLIPSFLLVQNLHMMNSFSVYILPGLVNAFNIFMIRSYMDNLPGELQESAKMDGANDLVIFFRIVLPLSQPVLATIALFIAVGQWNSWFDTYIYNGSTPELTTLQFELRKIIDSTQSGNDMARGNDVSRLQAVSPESIKMAITVVTIVPILLVYPFLQRYFVRGMTLGAVKA